MEREYKGEILASDGFLNDLIQLNIEEKKSIKKIFIYKRDYKKFT